ncbi:MAG: NAD-dependent protein deacylase [Bacilli bacterium]|nr:NAD-dependent protein deacylase [Bacilli bacterium]
MASLQEDAELLQSLIDSSHNIVFFGGAGVSTESGIPDFRSKDGLYHQKYKYDPEEIISHHFFYQNTKEFYRFYKDRMIDLNAKPNAAHKYLAELEKAGRLKYIITQNIDGLHQMAGSKKVIEVHGSVHRNYCQDCEEEYDARYIKECKEEVPHCPNCGGLIKPDVVLYEEPLNEGDITRALGQIMSAEILIVAGTSLVVYPAAGFINYFKGKHLVLINKDPSAADSRADVVIHQKVGELFSLLHV